MLNLTQFTDPYANVQTPSMEEIAGRKINHIGRTNSGRFAYAGVLSYSTEDDFPPESKYWKSYAMGAAHKLAKIIGNDAYFEFGEICWPGDTIQLFTWRTICEMIEEAIPLAESGERDAEKLAAAAHGKLEKLVASVAN